MSSSEIQLNKESDDECKREYSRDIFDDHNDISRNEVSFSVFIDSEWMAT